MNKLEVGGTLHQEKENKSIINLIGIEEKEHKYYKVLNNKELTINVFSLKRLDLTIDVDLYDSSKLYVNVAFINKDKVNLNININLLKNNSLANVSVRGINKGNDINIILNSSDLLGTDGNIVNEYAKIINHSDAKNILIPNLLVNSYNIVANHGVSIGSLDKEMIFYLLSKGISKKEAYNLLEEGFILMYMEESIKEEIRKLIKGEK